MAGAWVVGGGGPVWVVVGFVLCLCGVVVVGVVGGGCGCFGVGWGVSGVPLLCATPLPTLALIIPPPLYANEVSQILSPGTLVQRGGVFPIIVIPGILES